MASMLASMRLSQGFVAASIARCCAAHVSGMRSTARVSDVLPAAACANYHFSSAASTKRHDITGIHPAGSSPPPHPTSHSHTLCAVSRATALAPNEAFVRRLSTSGSASSPKQQQAPELALTSLADLDKEGADLTPARVVELLDRHIVGQAGAKRAVAIALRNRWRRKRIEGPIRDEVVPKNILLIGPTGCGKTEIARRLAKLIDAPFVKVEATKFTEVGFHGRDVDQIVRDLVENAIHLQRQKVRTRLLPQLEEIVEKRVIDLLTGPNVDDTLRQVLRAHYRSGQLDNRRVQVEVPEAGAGAQMGGMDLGGGFNLNELVSRMERVTRMQARAERREMTIGEARPLLLEAELEKVVSSAQIIREAIQAAEQDGIVFIDEIDKIVSTSDNRHGADASSEGVQRDLLPIIEGSVVSTKHGNVNTEHMLFICSGAFHSSKPSDMLAELQGRLPIRVELKGLTKQDLYRILTEPETNMIRQQQLLMATEDIDLIFTNDAINEMASMAAEVNRALDNIGARRLHTVIERVVEDISFNAPSKSGEKVVIDKEDVLKSVGDLVQKMDVSKFIL